MNNRRSFLKDIGKFMVLAVMPVSAAYANNGRIIIVGGGVAGTRTAAYLKASMPAASIMLIDPARGGLMDKHYAAIHYQSRPVAREVLAEMGIEMIADQVTQVNPADRSVKTARGMQYKADVLVLAPGVDFKWDAVKGYRPGMEHEILHAWHNAGHDSLLWQQIKSMDNGEAVVISVPPAPYRFMQGPYQRATKIADYLKQYKPKSKVLILDHNDQFPSMQAYLEHWENSLPPGMVEWVAASNGGVVESYDFRKRHVRISGQTIHAGVLNLIPPQQAGSVARLAGLTDNSDWCPVIPSTLQSVQYKNVYVTGDANNANPQNKTAAMAEQHAVKCMTSIKTLMG
jgi:sulfide dehydrogenase [flavocytochrome c] flavoprotein subunit